jgi:TM2 domain-containing membrane protein YozV
MGDLGNQPLFEAKYGSELKSVALAYILFFVGSGFGAHRFYLRKPGTAILFMFTFGGFGIWWLIDIITLARQVDIYNEPLREKYQTFQQ